MDKVSFPKVSIIIPSYNHSSFVGAAIESVLAQTCGDFELIVIDDASCDDTWEAIQSFSDSRIKAFRHETNQGAVETINEGLRLASGSFLTILNSDDIYHPSRLQKLLNVIVKENAEFIFTDVELIDSLGTIICDESHGWLTWFAGLKAIYKRTADIPLVLLSGNVTVSTSNMFFSAEVLKRIGYFDEYRYAHDYDFVLRYMADPKAKLHFLAEEKLLSYRLHGSNTITESGLDTAREVFGILTRWLADLAPSLSRNQLSAVAGHLIFLEQVIESELSHAAQQYATQARKLRESHSFKLGQMLVVPAKALLNVFR